MEYDWDRHHEGHIAEHKVGRNEVEEVLANGPQRIKTRIDSLSGEERILELGHTNAGRVLSVVWTPRSGLIRPVTAFDADRATRAAYERRRHEQGSQPTE